MHQNWPPPNEEWSGVSPNTLLNGHSSLNLNGLGGSDHLVDHAEPGSSSHKRSRQSTASATGKTAGRPRDDWVERLTNFTNGRYCCIGTNCTQTWQKRSPLRVKAHAAVCSHLPDAIRSAAEEAVKVAAEHAEMRKSKAISNGADVVMDEDEDGEGDFENDEDSTNTHGIPTANPRAAPPISSSALKSRAGPSAKASKTALATVYQHSSSAPLPKSTANKPLVRLLSSKYFEPIRKIFLYNQCIIVDTYTGLIISLNPASPDATPDSLTQIDGIPTVDLRSVTLLPGLVDAHVHLFLHPYSEKTWVDQVLGESIVERTVRAVTHAKKTLMAGYTTVRDLGTEGALDSDVHLRASLSPPLSLAPSPRIYIATRAIVSTGAYGPRTEKWDEKGGEERIFGAEIADGVDGCRRVVRRQIGKGADVIKVYADYPTRAALLPFSPRMASPSYPLFTMEELVAIVETAKSLGVKVAAHSTSAATMKMCVEAGVATIEHGYDGDRETFEMMKSAGTIWVPTLAAYSRTVELLSNEVTRAQSIASFSPSPVSDAEVRRSVTAWKQAEDRWTRMQRAFKLGLEVGVKISCGGDTGTFAHGDNALELQRMVQLGAPTLSVLSWATLGGWECVRSMAFEGEEGTERISKWTDFSLSRHQSLAANFYSSDATLQNLSLGPDDIGDHDKPFGVIAVGFAADLIGVNVDLEKSFLLATSGARAIPFVMKDGIIVKHEGREVDNTF